MTNETLLGERECRFCYDTTPEYDLISPCLCHGTMKWIHRSCLDEFRSTRPDSWNFIQSPTDIDNFKTCSTCKFDYHLQEQNGKSRLETLLQRGYYYTRIVIDLVIVFALYQLVAGVGLGWFCWWLDSTNMYIANTIGFVDPRISYFIAGNVMMLDVVALVWLVYAIVQGPRRNYHSSYNSTNYYIFPSSSSRNDTHSSSSGASFKSGEKLSDGFVLIAIVLAMIGVIIGLFYAIGVIAYITRRHVQYSWLKSEAKQKPVYDFAHGSPTRV